MANRRRGRAAKAGRNPAMVGLALEMEEPLYFATHHIRTVEQVKRPHDEEMEAVAFVATQARLQFETLHDLWRRLVDQAAGRPHRKRDDDR